MFVASSLLNSKVLQVSRVVDVGESFGVRKVKIKIIKGIEIARAIIIIHLLSILVLRRMILNKF